MGNFCCSGNFDVFNANLSRDSVSRSSIFSDQSYLNLHRTFKEISRILTPFTSQRYLQKQIPDYNSPNFSDFLFPSELKSLTYVDPDSDIANDITPEEIAPFKSLIWLRPKEIFGNDNFKLYYTIDINDINQGILGNCYFLSSLSALAEFPERFEKIFIKKEVTVNGCYSVQFYVNGKPKIVTIDDKFPCDPKTKKWAFSHAGAKEIWVQILEKAWAKVCGSYACTIAGLPSEALSTLCEAPCVSYIHRRYDKSVIWNILLESDKKNYIICTNSTDKQEAEKEGIALSHAYTVISCIEAQGIKFVKLRNPWGQFEWKGDYSDNSPLWNDALKKELGYVKANDGVFFMTFEDFIKFYPYTFACKFETNFIYDYKKFKPETNTNFIAAKFKLNAKTKISIGLHQKQVRFYRKIKGYKPQYARLLVGRFNPEDHSYEFIGSDFSNNEKLYVSQDELLPGEYHIFGQVNWSFEEYKCSFVISTYASSLVRIEQANLNDIPIDWLNQLLTSFLKKNKKSKEVIRNIESLESFEDNHTGYLAVNYKNTGNSTVSFSLKFHTNEQLKLVSKHFGSKDSNNNHFIKVYIPPKESKTIIFEVLDIYKTKFSVDNYNSKEVSNYLNINDKNSLVLSRYLDHLEKEAIVNGIYYMEVKIRNIIYFVFVNESYQAKLKAKFTQLTNVTSKFIVNQEFDMVIESDSFNFISAAVLDNSKPYECQLSFSLS